MHLQQSIIAYTHSLSSKYVHDYFVYTEVYLTSDVYFTRLHASQEPNYLAVDTFSKAHSALYGTVKCFNDLLLALSKTFASLIAKTPLKRHAFYGTIAYRVRPFVLYFRGRRLYRNGAVIQLKIV